MSSSRNRPGIASLILIAGSLTVATEALAGTGKHPTLIDPAKAKCVTCHDVVMKGKVKHAPAEEDCLSCHSFEKADGKTAVKLSGEMPGLCLTCHDSLTAAAEGKLPAPHAPVADCASCHKPHASDEKHLLKASARQICAECHSADDVNKGHAIPVSRSDCLTCHLPHGGDAKGFLAGSVRHGPFQEKSCGACHRRSRGTKTRFQQEGGALCFACHSEVENSLAKGFVHTALKQGQCVGCHDPHLSREPKLLRRKGPDLCLPCHGAVREKVAAEGAHAPARKDCAACHDAHRSGNRAQLVEAIPGLCLKCHAAKDGKLSARHLGADVAKLDCTSCHDPHGSKRKKLIASGSVHARFESGCDACHEGKTTALAVKDVRELCLACHGDVSEAARKQKVTHAAMEGECTVCHTPHASAQTKLVKSPGGEVCIACHDDQKTKEDHVEHGVIGILGCQSCHLPHGGANPKLLRTVGNDLCNGCHLAEIVKPATDGSVLLPGGGRLVDDDAKRLRRISLDPSRKYGHPQPGHPVAGTAKDDPKHPLSPSILGKELSCTTCHSPHSGKSRQMFSAGATSQSELCLRCHPK